MDVTISTEQMQIAAEAMRHKTNMLTWAATPEGKAWIAARGKTKALPIAVPIRVLDVDPVDQLHAIAAEIEKTTGVSPAEAAIAATTTPEGKAAYAAYREQMADAVS